jgi:hypothetical protein
MGRGGLRSYKSETRVECNVRVIYRRIAILENKKFIFQKFYELQKLRKDTRGFFSNFSKFSHLKEKIQSSFAIAHLFSCVNFSIGMRFY